MASDFRASDLAHLDLTDAELYRRGFPHEVFSTLRREAPVFWQSVPDGFPGNGGEGFWVLSKYADVQAANRDAALFSAIDGPNRDEDTFDDPCCFDIHREPNEHIAFGGGGPHYCLGANLARREIEILFEELLGRTRQIEVLGPASYSTLSIYKPILVAPKELPVRLS